MSTITNVILAFDLEEARGDDGGAGILAEVNRYENFYGHGFIVPEGKWYGGTYALERLTFVGAFNYLGLDEFIAHLRSLPWKEPGNVQLFVCRQDDSRYELTPVFLVPAAGTAPNDLRSDDKNP